MSENAGQGSGEKREVRAHRKPWTSKTLILAAIIGAIGVVLSGYAYATRPAVQTTGGGVGDSAMTTGLSAKGPGAPAQTFEQRIVDRAGPFMSKFGLSFVAGFFLGYAFKRFVKITALVTGIALLGLFAAQKAGLITMPWNQVQEQLQSGVGWATEHAAAYRDAAKTYLPSGVAGAVGIFMGFRRG
jgi:uncharacterized membrane protein (Fun14 family)